MTNLNLEEARKLSYTLRRNGNNLKLRAEVRDDRIVFSGGKQGEHSLAVTVSSKARVLAHWEGYIENNGLRLAPKKGERVYFVTGSQNYPRIGLVVSATRQWVSVAFKYNYGRKTVRKMRLSEVTF